MGVWGGVLWNLYIYVGSGYFFWFKILNFNILGFSEKWIFLGVWRFCGYFWGVTTKLAYIQGSFLCILGVFLGQGTEWGIFFGNAKISNMWTVDAGPEPTCGYWNRVSPLGWNNPASYFKGARTLEWKFLLDTMRICNLSSDMWFPAMWHFDKCRLRLACAASF